MTHVNNILKITNMPEVMDYDEAFDVCSTTAKLINPFLTTEDVALGKENAPYIPDLGGAIYAIYTLRHDPFYTMYEAFEVGVSVIDHFLEKDGDFPVTGHELTYSEAVEVFLRDKEFAFWFNTPEHAVPFEVLVNAVEDLLDAELDDITPFELFGAATKLLYRDMVTKKFEELGEGDDDEEEETEE